MRAKPRTVEFAKFSGMNVTDARPCIDDDELAWLENMVTVGHGAIQGVPTKGTALATIAAGVASIWGFTLVIAGVPRPVLITINTDGSISQIRQDTAAVTAVAPAGSVSTSAALDIWQASTILIIDPTFGYQSWTGGGVYAVIDAAKTGYAVAVFEGRVWLARNAGRTIEYTAPNTFNSFVAGDGAGSFILTDSAFPGNIVTLRSALEQLWIIGQGAIEAVANVQSTGAAGSVITTFSVTNIVTGLGSNARGSVIGYFRALTFASPSGIYALAGVTPQKLSDKLDGMFPGLTLGDAPAAVATVQNLLTLCVLVTYTQSLVPALPTPASGLSTATKLVLCFTQGKWFVASQGNLVWITTLIVGGVSQAWGTDGSTVYQLFGGALTANVATKLVTKLYSLGQRVDMKAQTKLGFEFQSLQIVAPMVTMDNEYGSQPAALSASNVLTIVNVSGAVLTLKNNTSGTLTIIVGGMILSKLTAAAFGHYLGVTVTGNDPPYRLQAIEMETTVTRSWDTK